MSEWIVKIPLKDYTSLVEERDNLRDSYALGIWHIDYNFVHTNTMYYKKDKALSKLLKDIEKYDEINNTLNQEISELKQKLNNKKDTRNLWNRIINK